MQSAQELAKELSVTPGRILSIAKEIFKDDRAFFKPEDVTQIAGVVAIMKSRQERSIRIAVKAYNDGIAAEVNSNPREYAAQNAIATTGKLGNTQIAQEDLELANMRALRRFVGIRESENEMLARLLNGGVGNLPVEVEQVLEDSQSKVYDAGLGKFEAVGGYLPAMVSGAMMLSAAAVEENQAA